MTEKARNIAPTLTIADDIHAWEVSVRMAGELSPERSEAIEEGFRLAYERADAVVQGRLDPLRA